VQPFPDLSVRQRRGNQREHFQFPIGEGGELRPTLCSGRPAYVFLNNMTRDGGRQKGIAAGCNSHGFGKLPGSHILQEKPTGAGAQGFVYVFATIEGGQNDDARRVGKLQQSPRSFESVTDRHPNVHQRNVRPEAASQFDRLDAIGGLRNNGKVWLPLDNRSESIAYECLVVS
jgi:hypothetical protein